MRSSEPLEPVLTLLDLANAAVAATLDDPEGSDLTVSKIFSLLDVMDSLNNRHLANPLNHPRRGYIRPRECAFSGLEPVYGDFLALVYCSHDPFVLLREYDSRQSLEGFLTWMSGPINPFITYCIVLIEGRVEPYRLACTAPDGSACFFDPILEGANWHHPIQDGVERWVVWKNEPSARPTQV
jgi:hypothetical protein